MEYLQNIRLKEREISDEESKLGSSDDEHGNKDCDLTDTSDPEDVKIITKEAVIKAASWHVFIPAHSTDSKKKLEGLDVSEKLSKVVRSFDIVLCSLLIRRL